MKAINAALLVLVAMSAPSVLAEIVITPAAPTTAHTITIRAGANLTREARVESAAIVRTGEYSFSVQLAVAMRCDVPPGAPRFIGSEFNVGPLPAGTYAITVHTTFADVAPPGSCGPIPPITETASFEVAGAPIPLLDYTGLLLLIVSIGTVAVLMLEVRGR